MHCHSPGSSVPGRDQMELSACEGQVDRLLLVAGRDSRPLGHNPNLQEMNGFGARSIEFAMSYAAAGAHPLLFVGTDHRTIAEAVLILDRPFQHVGHDLHVPSAVGW